MERQESDQSDQKSDQVNLLLDDEGANVSWSKLITG